MTDRFTVRNIVDKLIGPITPLGETNEDSVRYKNLEELCGLTHSFLTDIEMLRKYKNVPEHSRKKAGEYADDFLSEIALDFDLRNVGTEHEAD
jgi:DNA-binding MltR family transcriptional regulator